MTASVENITKCENEEKDILNTNKIKYYTYVIVLTRM